VVRRGRSEAEENMCMTENTNMVTYETFNKSEEIMSHPVTEQEIP
jgi:hypothetical protein